MLIESFVLAATVGLSDDAASLLEASAEACQAVHAATYDARLERRVGDRTPSVVTGEVALAKWPPPPPPPPAPEPDEDGVIRAVPMMRMQPMRPPSPFKADVRLDLDLGATFIVNNGVITVINAERRSVTIAEPGSGAEERLMDGPRGAMLASPLLDDRPYGEVEGDLEIVGREVIDGVDCVVVQASEKDQQTLRWSIGAEDHLPRAVEEVGPDRRGQAVRTRLLITNLELEPELAPETFAFDVPENWRVDRLKPEPRGPLVAKGSAAPAYELKDADGVTHTLEQHKGKIVVLDFWGTWCGPCVQAMPAIQAIHDRYHERGVEVIGISCRERGGADPAAFMRDKGYDYGLLLNGETIVREYGISAFPTLVVIDRDGVVAETHIGAGKTLEQELGRYLDELLEDDAS